MLFEDLRFEAIHLEVAPGREPGDPGSDDVDFYSFQQRMLVNFPVKIERKLVAGILFCRNILIFAHNKP